MGIEWIYEMILICFKYYGGVWNSITATGAHFLYTDELFLQNKNKIKMEKWNTKLDDDGMQTPRRGGGNSRSKPDHHFSHITPRSIFNRVLEFLDIFLPFSVQAH